MSSWLNSTLLFLKAHDWKQSEYQLDKMTPFYGVVLHSLLGLKCCIAKNGECMRYLKSLPWFWLPLDCDSALIILAVHSWSQCSPKSERANLHATQAGYCYSVLTENSPRYQLPALALSFRLFLTHPHLLGFYLHPEQPLCWKHPSRVDGSSRCVTTRTELALPEAQQIEHPEHSTETSPMLCFYNFYSFFFF